MEAKHVWALAGVVGSALAVGGVVAKARHDSADAARCGVLVAMGSRCCAPGQHVERGACRGRPISCPEPLELSRDGAGCVPRRTRTPIPGGRLHVGPMDWEAEGRVAPWDATIASFELDTVETTEHAYAECVRAGACTMLHMSGEPGLPMVGLSRTEAAQYCAFRGGRVPREEEWTWAAAGVKGRRYPWGETGAVCRRGAWGLRDGPCSYDASGPEIAGSHPAGATPEGVLDLSGNVAEWVLTSGADVAMVRGGSWASGFAAELRTWHARSLSAEERSAEVGVRCAYDIPSSAEHSEGEGVSAKQ